MQSSSRRNNITHNPKQRTIPSSYKPSHHFFTPRILLPILLLLVLQVNRCGVFALFLAPQYQSRTASDIEDENNLGTSSSGSFITQLILNRLSPELKMKMAISSSNAMNGGADTTTLEDVGNSMDITTSNNSHDPNKHPPSTTIPPSPPSTSLLPTPAGQHQNQTPQDVFEQSLLNHQRTNSFPRRGQQQNSSSSRSLNKSRLDNHLSELPESYNGRNSLYLFSESHSVPSCFSLEFSTQENYGVEDKEFYGRFSEIRRGLDFDYHGNYSKERQIFQDRIVEKLLDGTTIHDTTNGRVCKTPTEPWIVFTAGVMGAGKSHTMKQVSSKNLFPLKSYVVVDPDEIRSHFPEYHLFAKQCPKRAGELTHREAGYVTEIVTAAALQRGYNVLVDGSLWDYKWYEEYFASLRKEYKVLRIAILHITAPREAVFERAKNRAKDTGRVVPDETLEKSLEQVPISVKKLAPLADFFCELDNSEGEVKLSTKGISWDTFRDNWAQVCPWPGHKRENTT